jgi:amino acid permease
MNPIVTPQVIEHHTQTSLDQRVYIAALLVPLLLLGWVPNLKYLAPVSMVANLFMAAGLGITMYYLVQDIPAASTRTQFNASLNTIPQFFSIVIFAMEAIGVVSGNFFMELCTVCLKNPHHKQPNAQSAGNTGVYLKVSELSR